MREVSQGYWIIQVGLSEALEEDGHDHGIIQNAQESFASGNRAKVRHTVREPETLSGV